MLRRSDYTFNFAGEHDSLLGLLFIGIVARVLCSLMRRGGEAASSGMGVTRLEPSSSAETSLPSENRVSASVPATGTMTRGDEACGHEDCGYDGPNVTDSGVRSALAAAGGAAGGETMGSSPCTGLVGGPLRTTADGAE